MICTLSNPWLDIVTTYMDKLLKDTGILSCHEESS